MSRSGLTIAVIGGGASGMIAAGTACSYGADVTIFEHSDRLGKKLAITGKGRCNVTNNCDEKEFLANVTRNPRFLFSAIYAFPPAKTIELFNELGVELKTERGNRVFPVSDKAKDIVDALVKYCRDCKKKYENVIAVKKASDSFLIETNKGTYQFDRVIISTGGKSYPLTGSDGSGYKIALKLGHTISAITPSLIPIESSSPLCAEMMGLSLKNVSIRIVNENGKTLYSDFGEMLFTHFGVTGPIVLSASAHIKDLDVSSLSMIIDLKPALDEKTLDTRLLSDFSNNSNKLFC